MSDLRTMTVLIRKVDKSKCVLKRSPKYTKVQLQLVPEYRNLVSQNKCGNDIESNVVNMTHSTHSCDQLLLESVRAFDVF